MSLLNLTKLLKRDKLAFRIGDRAIHKINGRRGTVVGIGTRVGPEGVKYPVISVEFDLSTGSVDQPKATSYDAAANEYTNLTRSRHNG